MPELFLTNQSIPAQNLWEIDIALRAAYPPYGGLNYEGGGQVLRLMFATLPAENELTKISTLVKRAPVFSRHVTGLFERRPTWR